MRHTSALAINLTSASIELALPKSGGRSALSVDVALPDEVNAWIESISNLAPVLRQAGDSLGIDRACVRMTYESPSLTTRLVTQAAPSESQAVAAARLSSTSGAHYGSAVAVTDACLIGRDLAAATGADDESPARYHVVSATDREAVIEALVTLIERCGWTISRLEPLESFVIAQEARAALAHRSSAPQARLFLGRRHSVLSVGYAGRLCLFRRIGFGIDLVTEALCKPIALDSAGNRETHLTHDQALEVLYECGLPARDAVICEGAGIKGYHVLPLIQPVLQRLLVELKQSLRFGLNEFEPKDIQGALVGAGACVPGLASLLSESTGIEFTASGNAHAPSTPADPAWDAYAFGRFVANQGDEHGPNLLPPSVVSRAGARRIRYGLAAGCTAAILLIGADSGRLNHAIASARAQLDQAVRSNENMLVLADQKQQVIENNGRLQQLENQLATTYHYRVDWAAVIKEVTRLLPPEIRIIQIDAASHDAEAGQAGRMTIHAYALNETIDDAIQQYLTRLAASPLVASVSIGPIQKVALDGRFALRFSVETRLHALDRAAGDFDLAGAADTGQ